MPSGRPRLSRGPGKRSGKKAASSASKGCSPLGVTLAVLARGPGAVVASQVGVWSRVEGRKIDPGAGRMGVHAPASTPAPGEAARWVLRSSANRSADW